MKSAGNGGRRPEPPLGASCSCIFLQPHWVPATWRSRAQTSIRAEFPSGERPQHARPPTDLSVQPLDHVVGTDARPVLAGKIAVGQRFLCTILGHSLLSPFRMVCGNFILPEPACYVFFMRFSICATYCTLSYNKVCLIK